jgi:hypothetical protein
VLDLTGESPEPEEVQRQGGTNDTVMQDAENSTQSPAKRPAHRDDAEQSKTPTLRKQAIHLKKSTMLSKKQVTPEKGTHSRKPSSSSQMTGHNFKTSIEDSETTAQEVEIPDHVPIHHQVAKVPILQFDPLPDLIFEPPVIETPELKAFVDWKPPLTPAEFLAIQQEWVRNYDEFRDDHARFASVSFPSCLLRIGY